MSPASFMLGCLGATRGGVSMKPSATGLIFTEFTVERPAVEGFKPFHSGEHVHERLAIAGVVGARRYVSTSEDNLFIGFYRARSAEVFLGPDYKTMGASPSEETKRQIAFVKGSRFLGDIVDELGDSHGALAYRIRIPAEPADDPGVADWFAGAGPSMIATPTIARVLLAKPRRGLENVGDTNWILLVEGYDPRTFETLPRPDGASVHTFRLEEIWVDAK